MLTPSDIKIIKDLLKGFATKDDLKGLATKDDLTELEKKFDKRFNKIGKRFDKIDKKFTDLFDLLDKDVMKGKQRLNNIEKILNISPLSS